MDAVTLDIVTLSVRFRSDNVGSSLMIGLTDYRACGVLARRQAADPAR